VPKSNVIVFKSVRVIIAENLQACWRKYGAQQSKWKKINHLKTDEKTPPDCAA
jgi:hypothetical protein